MVAHHAVHFVSNLHRAVCILCIPIRITIQEESLRDVKDLPPWRHFQLEEAVRLSKAEKIVIVLDDGLGAVAQPSRGRETRRKARLAMLKHLQNSANVALQGDVLQHPYCRRQFTFKTLYKCKVYVHFCGNRRVQCGSAVVRRAAPKTWQPPSSFSFARDGDAFTPWESPQVIDTMLRAAGFTRHPLWSPAARGPRQPCNRGASFVAAVSSPSCARSRIVRGACECLQPA
jgi:hypothetical protein